MRSVKKLLSFVTAFALTMQMLPAVFADLEEQPVYPEETAVTEQAEDNTGETSEPLPEETASAEQGDGTAETQDTLTEETDIADDDTVFSLRSTTAQMPKISGKVTINREENGVPAGLKPNEAYVSEILHDILNENNMLDYTDSFGGKIAYTSDSVVDSATFSIVGWNDIITLSSYYHRTLQFVLTADQFSTSAVRVIMDVYFTSYDDSLNRALDNSSNFFDENGCAVPVKRSNNYSWSRIYISPEHLDKVGTLMFRADVPANYNARAYEGELTDEEAIAGAVDISDAVFKNGCPIDKYDNGDYYGHKEFTVVAYDTAGNAYMNIQRLMVCAMENYVTVSYDTSSGLYDADDVYVGSGHIERAGDFSGLDTEISCRYSDFVDTGSSVSDTIVFACEGNYASQADAVTAGAADISSDLFGSGYTVDIDKCSPMTTYLWDGTEVDTRYAELSIFDIYGSVYHETAYFGIYPPGSAPDPGLSDYTSLDVYNAAVKKDDTEQKKNLKKFIIDSSDDSYYRNGYQTLLLLDDGAPVTDSVIYPIFSNSSGAKVLIESGESAQVSGESSVNFENGKAIEYTVISESEEKTQNYWVTFLTRQSGPKLFVNAANDPSHYSDNGRPEREILLTSRYSNYHDIAIANIGDQALTGISVTLSEDTVGVKLDDYWRVIEGSERTLGAFNDITGSNVAKIRLLPIDEDKFCPISGSLTISADGQEPVVIDLTGIAGIPEIVTDSIPDGVRYVPFSRIIQTNSMYKTDVMKFSVTSGSLPDGITLNSDTGELYGIPTTPGDYSFVVTAEYTGKTAAEINYSDSQYYCVTIKDNTDEYVDGVNSDDQGYALTDRVSRNITVYYTLNDEDTSQSLYSALSDFDSVQLGAIPVNADETALNTPENLKAIAGNGQVTVKWSAVESADGYILYCFRDGNNIIYEVVTDTPETFYVHYGLKNGDIYNYYVVAYKNVNNERLCSSASGTISVRVGAGAAINITSVEMDNDLCCSEGEYNSFLDFYIDGIKLTEGIDYIAEEGSTKITVQAQTFGNADITGSDVPHTLAAEFRTEDGELKRSAQNVYITYNEIPESGSPDITIQDQTFDDTDIPHTLPTDINNNGGGGTGSDSTSSGSGGTGSSGSGTGVSGGTDSAAKTEYISISMRVIGSSGESVPGLRLELRSTPQKGTTDSSGNIDFDKVEFGKHKLYVLDANGKRIASESFSLVSGSGLATKGTVITAKAGTKINISLQYDNEGLKILSVQEDMASGAPAADNSVSVDFMARTSGGAALPKIKLPRIKKYSTKRRKYRILKKRKLADLVFVY